MDRSGNYKFSHWYDETAKQFVWCGFWGIGTGTYSRLENTRYWIQWTPVDQYVGTTQSINPIYNGPAVVQTIIYADIRLPCAAYVTIWAKNKILYATGSNKHGVLINAQTQGINGMTHDHIVERFKNAQYTDNYFPAGTHIAVCFRAVDDNDPRRDVLFYVYPVEEGWTDISPRIIRFARSDVELNRTYDNLSAGEFSNPRSGNIWYWYEVDGDAPYSQRAIRCLSAESPYTGTAP